MFLTKIFLQFFFNRRRYNESKITKFKKYTASNTTKEQIEYVIREYQKAEQESRRIQAEIGIKAPDELTPQKIPSSQSSPNLSHDKRDKSGAI